MAGATADRKLSNASVIRFAVGTKAEDAAIRCLLRDNCMPGAVRLTFEREPDYFDGTDLAGGEDQTIVAFCDGRLVCMGRCTRRECWLDGVARRVGYLAELRLDATARGRFGILRDGYEFFRKLEHDDPADIYFTSISADNDRARRLLEKGLPGLPGYVFLAELDTLLIAVPRRLRPTKLRLESAAPVRVPELLRVLNEGGRRHQFATVWTEKNLRALERHGLPPGRFLVALDGAQVIACGAVWDQRGFRQIAIRGYRPVLSAMRPFVNAVSRLFGMPRLPRAGSMLAHAFLSPLAFARGAEAILPDFIEAAFPLAAQTGAEFLTIALPTTDPRLAALRRRFSTRTWRSRLYRVDWPGGAPVELTGRGATFLPEVAFL